MTHHDLHVQAGAASRPWGHFQSLLEAPDFKLKILCVSPGQRLSLQRHGQRAEHWHVVRGSAEVTVGASVFTLGTGESIDIPVHAWHRLGNRGDTELVVVEVQRGTYFGEDDIERAEDDYDRQVSGKLKVPTKDVRRPA